MGNNSVFPPPPLSAPPSSALSALRPPSLSCSSAVVPALMDRLGDSKEQVREQSQALILRLMEQTAPVMVSVP